MVVQGISLQSLPVYALPNNDALRPAAAENSGKVLIVEVVPVEKIIENLFLTGNMVALGGNGEFAEVFNFGNMVIKDIFNPELVNC